MNKSETKEKWETTEVSEIQLKYGEVLPDIEKSVMVISFNDTATGIIMSKVWNQMSFNEKKETGLTDLQVGKVNTIILPAGMSLSILLPDGTVRGIVDYGLDKHIKEVVVSDILDNGPIRKAIKAGD